MRQMQMQRGGAIGLAALLLAACGAAPAPAVDASVSAPRTAAIEGRPAAADVDALRERARQAMQASRLFAPAGDNALEHYLALRAQAPGAKLITSVCTGSLVLAAAGLLDGYRAGCHWAWGEQLALFGATFVPERVVFDRNRITAGGVTSGIDFAFKVIESMHGRDTAEAIQLTLEYDPAPLGGGTPATARPEILTMVKALLDTRMGDRVIEIEAASKARH